MQIFHKVMWEIDVCFCDIGVKFNIVRVWYQKADGPDNDDKHLHSKKHDVELGEHMGSSQ